MKKSWEKSGTLIRLHVEDRLKSGEEIPQPEYVSMTSIDVAV
jgi:hypothetical protein